MLLLAVHSAALGARRVEAWEVLTQLLTTAKTKLDRKPFVKLRRVAGKVYVALLYSFDTVDVPFSSQSLADR
jgi:hypothetical protein